MGNFEWLRRLPALVDTDATALISASKPSELDYLRQLVWLGAAKARCRMGTTPTPKRCSYTNIELPLSEARDESTRPSVKFGSSSEATFLPDGSAQGMPSASPREPARASRGSVMPGRSVVHDAEREEAATKIEAAVRGRIARARTLDVHDQQRQSQNTSPQPIPITHQGSFQQSDDVQTPNMQDNSFEDNGCPRDED